MSDSKKPHVYEIDYLLDRMYDQLNKQKNIAESTKLVLSKPEVLCENKKTFIKRFDETCLKLSRTVDEVKKFFEDELLKKSSIDGKGNLIICGMFRQKQIQSILMSYIKQCVMCKECNSTDTKIYKEDRVLYLECNKCKSKKAQ